MPDFWIIRYYELINKKNTALGGLLKICRFFFYEDLVVSYKCLYDDVVYLKNYLNTSLKYMINLSKKS